MVKTAILNDRVQECRIYPDIYENSSNDASVEPSQLAIFLETQEDTMQVPFGTFSMLDALMDGSEKAFDAAIYLCHNAFSHWDWGVSHSLSIRFVGNIIRGRSPICAASTQTFTRKGMDQTSLW